MKRCEFTTLLSSGAASWSLTALAQQPAPASNAVRQDWLDRRKEPILDPNWTIIDAHHHLFNRPGRRYLLDELLADTGSGHNIVETVYVQASSMYRETGPVEMRPVGEVEFANGVAAMCASGYCGKTRAAAGIVGQADLTLGGRVEPVLVALVQAGGDRFRRHSAHHSLGRGRLHLKRGCGQRTARPGLLADKTFREGFAVLSRLHLSF